MSTGLILQAGDLLQLGLKFGGHVVPAEAAGSRYLVNAAAQKSRILSSCIKASQERFLPSQETIALTSKGRQVAIRHMSH